MSDVRKVTRAEQKIRRPLQILDAAFEEFVERGYVATRVEDIADRVGVTKGTIYFYFENKEVLFSQMIRHISTPFGDMLSNASTMEGSCIERLRRLIESFYSEIVDNRRTRELLRFVIAEGSRFPEVLDQHHSEFIDPLIEHVQSVLDEGVRRGEFRADSAALAEVVFGPVLSMMMSDLIYDNRRRIDRSAYQTAHLDLLFRGLIK